MPNYYGQSTARYASKLKITHKVMVKLTPDRFKLKPDVLSLLSASGKVENYNQTKASHSLRQGSQTQIYTRATF